MSFSTEFPSASRVAVAWKAARNGINGTDGQRSSGGEEKGIEKGKKGSCSEAGEEEEEEEEGAYSEARW